MKARWHARVHTGKLTLTPPRRQENKSPHNKMHKIHPPVLTQGGLFQLSSGASSVFYTTFASSECLNQ